MSPRPPSVSSPSRSRNCSTSTSPKCRRLRSRMAARSINSSVTPCWYFSATRRPRVTPRMPEPVCAWRSRCSNALPASTQNGAAAELSTRSRFAWASIRVSATSEISAATIAWTTQSSERRRTSPRAAVDRRTRPDRHQLRDLRVGPRHRCRPRAAADYDERHQPRSHSLSRQRRARCYRQERQSFQ